MPDENGNPTLEELQGQLQDAQRVLAQQNLTIWRAKAVEENPSLKPFQDLIAGEDEAQVMASAKALAERFGQAFPTQPPPPPPEPTAEQLYGQPGSGGNGVPLNQKDAILELEDRVRNNLPRGAVPGETDANFGRGEAKISKRDAKRFVDTWAQRYSRDMLISHGKLRPQPGERWRHTETGQYYTG